MNHSEDFFGKPNKDIIALYLENGTELLIHWYTIYKKIRKLRKRKIESTVSIFDVDICCLLPNEFDFVTEHFVNVMFRKSLEIEKNK